MVRRYQDLPVDSAAVRRIVDAARRGPSAGFAQGVEFILVTSASQRLAIAEAAGEADYVERGFEPWLSVAPVHVVVAVDVARYRARYSEPDKGGVESWTAPYWWVDAGAALMLLLLAAVEEGLGAGFLGSHAVVDLAAVLELPEHILPLGIVTIGHPSEADAVGSARRPRRAWDDVVHSERWTSGAGNDR